MGNKLNIKLLITKVIVAVFILTTSSGLNAQSIKSNNLKSFKVVVEMADNGIIIRSVKGSAWNDIAFSVNDDQPQAIDEYGMTELGEISSEQDSTLADFLFVITKTKTGIVLKGIKGTAWTDLRFTLTMNGKQAIDQFGMTEL